MNVATLAEKGITVELDGDQLRVRGDLDDRVIAEIKEHRDGLIAELRWPYRSAAEEPRCNSCSRWQRDAGNKCGKSGETFGKCLRHGYSTLELDNCKGWKA